MFPGACPPCPTNQQPYNITLCTCKLNGMHTISLLISSNKNSVMKHFLLQKGLGYEQLNLLTYQPAYVDLSTLICSGPKQDSTNSTAVIAGVIGAVVGVLIILGIMLCLSWKRKKDRAKLVGRFDIQLAEGKLKPVECEYAATEKN